MTVRKIRIVCDDCGSDNISFDAVAFWSERLSKFLYEMTDGDSYCSNCGSNGSREIITINQKLLNVNVL